MKIAVVSEGPADEAAVKILVDAVLRIETDLVALRRPRQGWPSVLNLLPAIITDLHYQQVDTDGLVVVVDSDDTTLHDASHKIFEAESASCRLCQMRGVAKRECGRLTPVSNRATIKFAFGLAVPAIEAWYRCGLDPHVNENTWGRKISGEPGVTYDRQSLKRDAYGSDRVSIFDKTDLAKQAAQKLTTDLDFLEQRFPNGFGSLRRDLLSWLVE
jgi:hypothetical protein